MIYVDESEPDGGKTVCICTVSAPDNALGPLNKSTLPGAYEARSYICT